MHIDFDADDPNFALPTSASPGQPQLDPDADDPTMAERMARGDAASARYRALHFGSGHLSLDDDAPAAASPRADVALAEDDLG